MSSLNTLRERIVSYEELNDLKLLKKLPVIIILNGRSFKKTTSLMDKPFSSAFLELMCATTIKLCQEIDGTIFAYSFNDEIIIVARNDQSETSAWYDNKIQKIVSASASIATLEFSKMTNSKKVELFGDAIFTAKTFVVPTISEAINALISKQQQAFHISLSMACFYELIKKYDVETVKQTLYEKTPQAKIEILFEERGIDFNNYPLPFRRGFSAYRVPKIISMEGGDQIKNKLIIDIETPIFTKDREFLENIFRTGRGIFKSEK